MGDLCILSKVKIENKMRVLLNLALAFTVLAVDVCTVAFVPAGNMTNKFRPANEQWRGYLGLGLLPAAQRLLKDVLMHNFLSKMYDDELATMLDRVGKEVVPQDILQEPLGSGEAQKAR